LRDRITALGGTPTMEVAKNDLIPAKTLKEILDVNINEEKKAIALYRSLLKMVEHDEVILYEAIEHIIEDEQEHWGSLTGCRSSVMAEVVGSSLVPGDP
jgi:bacterioferritin (cytochrome b1)